MGSLENGITGTYSILLSKSLLDGIFAMILSSMLVILPVAILILFVIAFGCYFLFFH